MQDNKKYAYGQQDSNLFQELISRYFPYWPVFTVLLLLGFALSYTYLRFQVPVYESRAVILVKDEKKGLENTEVMEQLNVLGSNKIVENEVEIIRSYAVASEVVRKLHLYAPVKAEHKFTDRSVYASAPIRIQAANPEAIAEVEEVPFTFVNNQVVIQDKSYALNTWVDLPWGKLKFVPNPLYKGNAAGQNYYFALQSIKSAAFGLIDGLKVAPSSKQSTVINLKFRDAEPRRGEDILNEIVKVYNEAAIKDKNQLAANTLSFVEDRLNYVVNELDSVENALARFKRSNKVTDISAQGRIFLESVDFNDQRVGEMNMQMAVLNQVEGYVRNKSATRGGIVPSTLGVADPVLSGLLDRLYETEMQYERLRKTTAENNPMLIALADQIEKIRPSILENVRNQRRSLEAGRSDIAATNSKYAAMLRTLPQKEQQLLEISRQQSIKNNIYTFLLQKREETALSYSSTVPDSRIVDAAVTTLFPVSPNSTIIYLIALVGSVILGAIFISLKEAVNRGILFRSEIEKFTSIPVLGEVVYDSSKQPIVIAEGKRTFVAEQFRQLRTSLGYLGINSRKKKILVTSTISGEGKSFIAANLGISLALVGKKVVLLELDLRKPQLSSIFKVNAAAGLTNFFIGEKEVEELLVKTEANSNLFLLPAGPIPPNPSELIMNGRLQGLLAYLETKFDYIIVDTAPVNPVTDAYIISPMCDATLYVIRHGFTPRAYVQKLDEQIKIRGLNNIAIIFNGVKERGYVGGSYGYAYGYESSTAYSSSYVSPVKGFRFGIKKKTTS